MKTFHIALFGAAFIATVFATARDTKPIIATPSPTVDTIFLGRFLTLDRFHPQAAAMAVLGGRIIAIGSESAVKALANESTRIVRFSGVALPGFDDAHIHTSAIGAQLERLNLRGLTKAAILANVAHAARSSSPGTWIQGDGWDQGFWHPATFPTAKDLDSVSGAHPVVLDRIDGHSTWVNSRVLELSKISRDTRDPEGGHIMRDAAGEPSGMLVDNAQELIRQVIPKPTHADLERQVRAALQQFTRWGLTSVQDAAVDLDTISIYKELLKRGELPVRVYVMAAGEQARRQYLATGPEVDLGSGMLTVRSFKLFSDGALGSRGAELTEPYADAPGLRGLELIKDADLNAIIRAAQQKGFQVNTHAIGDLAVRRVLDAYQRGGVTPQERFRVEHASIITDNDLPRFAQLGIIASIQPVFVGEYSRWADARVGPARAHWVLRTRDLLNSRARLAAGTDYPASDSGSPIDNLFCVVTRRGADGKPEAGWHPDQHIDVDQALRMMTIGPAYASFREKDLGELTVGRYADFTVLSADPYKIRSNALRSIAVRMTVVAGRVTFDASR